MPVAASVSVAVPRCSVVGSEGLCGSPPLAVLCAWVACGCAAASEDPLVFTRAQQFGMAAGVLCLLGILNLARVKTLGQLLAASAVYQVSARPCCHRSLPAGLPSKEARRMRVLGSLLAPAPS